MRVALPIERRMLCYRCEVDGEGQLRPVWSAVRAVAVGEQQ